MPRLCCGANSGLAFGPGVHTRPNGAPPLVHLTGDPLKQDNLGRQGGTGAGDQGLDDGGDA